MNIDITKIVSEKIEQLDKEGIIKKKIEDTLEKTIMDAITSELGSYSFRNSISEQIKESVSRIAADCGFSAYNGYISNAVKSIVQDLYTEDIRDKLQVALDDVLLQKHENIRLSDIFARYRTWVLEHTDAAEKYKHGEYTCDLEVEEDGAFTNYTCRFADHPLERSYYSKEKGDIEVKIYVYRENKTARISRVYLNGHSLSDSFKIGYLTNFEAFIVNLYFNETEIVIDPDDVDTDNSFDLDY